MAPRPRWPGASGTRSPPVPRRCDWRCRAPTSRSRSGRRCWTAGRAAPLSYAQLARAAGAGGAARAVGNAVGANPVAWLIPCHNVLRQDGALGGYHWGEDRKRAMLAWQALATPASPPASLARRSAGQAT